MCDRRRIHQGEAQCRPPGPRGHPAQACKEDAGLKLQLDKTQFLVKGSHPSLSHLSALLQIQRFATVGHEGNTCVPLGIDVFVQIFVKDNCMAIIDDVDKLDNVQDGFIHYQLLRFCRATRPLLYSHRIVAWRGIGVSFPQERSTADQVFYTWVARSRSGSSFTALASTFLLLLLLLLSSSSSSFTALDMNISSCSAPRVVLPGRALCLPTFCHLL